VRVDRFETLLYEEDDGVARVTLNRPEVHNAFDAQMQRELRGLWRSLRRNDDVRVVVLTGAGDQAFCTGIDRSETIAKARPGSGRKRGKKTGRAGSTPFLLDNPGQNVGPKACDLWKPVIAAVNGVACGGAFYMLGEAEFIIAAESATFFDPHVTYGMTSAYEPIHLLQKMPFHEVMRMALLGNRERMSAQRAYEIGLVSEVVPSAKLREAADHAARIIAAQPALAVQGTLRAIWMGRELSRSQALSLAHVFVALGTNSASIEAGQKAFASKKRPQWRLR
jgi:enoyl-CoA hydratase/carnithine racemase